MQVSIKMNEEKYELLINLSEMFIRSRELNSKTTEELIEMKEKLERKINNKSNEEITQKEIICLAILVEKLCERGE